MLLLLKPRTIILRAQLINKVSIFIATTRQHLPPLSRPRLQITSSTMSQKTASTSSATPSSSSHAADYTSTPAVLALPYDKFRKDALEPKIKWKERSESTHNTVHQPGLEAVPAVTEDGKFAFDVVYVGDSMLERLKTTGTSTSLHLTPDKSSFNVGVGGDKIENVLYRFHLGLCSLLYPRPAKLWVVQVGTNNLTPKRGFRPAVESGNYKLLLQMLMRLSPRSKVLCTGLFGRKDVPDDVVARSNAEIKKVVEEVNAELKEESIYYMDPPTTVGKDDLVDHVHLNEQGYKLWDEALYTEVENMISSVTA